MNPAPTGRLPGSRIHWRSRGLSGDHPGALMHLHTRSLAGSTLQKITKTIRKWNLGNPSSLEIST